MHSGYALALFYGVKLLNRGEIKDGGTVVTYVENSSRAYRLLTIFSVLFCMILASSTMGFIAPLIPDFTKAGAAAQQIVKMLGDADEHSPSKDDTPGVKLDSLRGELELKAVTFSYPERPTITVLENMSLHIPAGQVTAIVGHSGSGKSTVVGLLEKWYTADRGTILVDGQDLTTLDLPWWRTQIGLVQQVSHSLCSHIRISSNSYVGANAIQRYYLPQCSQWSPWS